MADTTNFLFYFRLALARLNKNEFGPALQLWNWALAYKDQACIEDLCAAQNNVACCYHGLKRYDEAIALSEAILDVAAKHFPPDNDLFQKCRNRIANCTAELNLIRSNELCAAAHAAFGRSNFDEAINLWAEAAKVRPSQTDNWKANRLLNTAACHYNTGRFANAGRLLAEVIPLAEQGVLAEEDFETYAWNRQRIEVGVECIEAHNLLDDASRFLDNEEWSDAENAAEEALLILDRSRFGRESMLGARLLDRLATAQYNQQRYADAVENWKAARWLSERWCGREQPELTRRIRNMLEQCRSH